MGKGYCNGADSVYMATARDHVVSVGGGLVVGGSSRTGAEKGRWEQEAVGRKQEEEKPGGAEGRWTRRSAAEDAGTVQDPEGHRRIAAGGGEGERQVREGGRWGGGGDRGRKVRESGR